MIYIKSSYKAGFPNKNLAEIVFWYLAASHFLWTIKTINSLWKPKNLALRTQRPGISLWIEVGSVYVCVYGAGVGDGGAGAGKKILSFSQKEEKALINILIDCFSIYICKKI